MMDKWLKVVKPTPREAKENCTGPTHEARAAVGAAPQVILVRSPVLMLL